MGDKTKISWADATWSPISGCSHASDGCRSCYAEVMERRFCRKWYGEDWKPWTEANAAHNVRHHPDRLEQPLHWRKPRKIFVCSMGDLFHELVPDDFIVKVFDVMRLNDRHRFQVLTKRVVRMFHWVMGYERTEGAPFAIQAPNVWLGTSVENQRAADERIPHLLQTPAAKRFVSAEPLLGPIEFDAPGRPWLTTEIDHEEDTRLDQIIVGGESGTKARPMHRDWVRSIRDQCLVTGTPFFFKQWGEWAPAGSRGEYCCNPGASIHDLETMNRVGKKAAGRELDGREWNEAPK